MALEDVLAIQPALDCPGSGKGVKAVALIRIYYPVVISAFREDLISVLVGDKIFFSTE